MATATLDLILRSETSDVAEPSCTTAVPGKYGAVPVDACNSYYLYKPNFDVNIVFAALFAVSTVIHFVQAIFFKKKYAWVVVMGVSWELIAFAVRADGAHHQQSLTHVIIGTLFMLLAPLWLNAFCFMTVARLIYYVVPEQAIWGIKSISVTKLFVGLDIISFIVQGSGGSLLSSDDKNTASIGQKIYMAGVGFQLAFILVFLSLVVKFFLMIRAREVDPYHVNVRKVKIVLVALTVALLLIILRIIYRLCEFGEGANEHNKLLQNEWYPICLDGLPMLLAFYLLNVVHPGLVLKGPDSEFPKTTRAERKQAKKDAKRAAKDARLQEKKQKKEGSKSYYVNESMPDNSYEMSDNTGRSSYV